MLSQGNSLYLKILSFYFCMLYLSMQMLGKIFIYTVGLGPFSADSLAVELLNQRLVSVEVIAQSDSSLQILGAPGITAEVRSVPGPRIVILAHRHDLVGAEAEMIRHYAEIFFNFRNQEEVKFLILFPIPNPMKPDHFEACLKVGTFSN
jgi:hypothetical protein